MIRTMFSNRNTVKKITIIISALLVIALLLPMIAQFIMAIFS